MDINPLNAANPYRNATVSASAGTGKTWMLTTRIIRLLLAGAPPSSILAITFTRKAAGEMRERVSDRLLELSQCSDEQRAALLTMMGEAVDADVLHRAKHLYWQLLASCETIRISTFHSFCQDILQGFALEAEVPAGFELLQQAGLTMDMAWEQLTHQATQDPNSKIALALDQLFDHLNTLFTTQKALYSFINQRSDWWAYTEGQEDPLGWAIEQLKLQLEVPDKPYALIERLEPDLAHFAEQLKLRKANASIDKFLAAIGEARLHLACQPQLAHERLCTALLTKDFKPRAYKHTGVLDKELKGAAADHVALFHAICSSLLRVREGLLRQQALALNTAWYTVGHQLIQTYQQLKEQRRQLDFGDLEWKTYELLHHADNADWVQYKLDQRINHLLFDEFQDTNPTQWQLVKPLLEELAASEQERHRSVFLVGDVKQSIYSFRRANPELQVQASQWLQAHLHADDYPLNLSRRSSPTVIDSVNHIFAQPLLRERLANFTQHGTYQKALWGRFELHPLVTSEKPQEVDIIPGENLRNPLTTARIEVKRDHHYREGRLIAQRIQNLVSQRIHINACDDVLGYGDIYILLKSRSHAADYEKALRDHGIPYVGTEKGTFLDNMEVQDMEALLNFLNMPFDNHRLAVILRSPLFHVDHSDLIALAQLKEYKTWWQRLEHLATQGLASPALQQAHSRISDWLEKTPQLPVHDLLDYIYHTGQVIPLYTGAVKAEKVERTRCNLIRFLEMALEIDSGRYPSLTRFLDQLKRLRNKDSATDKPDNAQTSGQQARVQFLTIHASKGLEAPVIFMADCFSGESSKDAWSPLVNWPSDQDRPTHFMLTPRKQDICTTHAELMKIKAQKESLENANLLYVALTRAKHMLIVTASCREEVAETEKDNWYQTILQGIQDHAKDVDGVLQLANGELDFSVTDNKPHLIQQENFDLAPPFDWSAVSPAIATAVDIAPSKIDAQFEGGSGDEYALQRGNYIHALLEQQAEPAPCYTPIKSELPEAIRMQCESQVRALLSDEKLAFLFAPQQYIEAKKEVSLQYPTGSGEYVYGIIDRLIIGAEKIIIVDYKTHQHVTSNNAHSLAEHYRTQLRYYVEGVEKIYTGKTITAGILFTHNKQWLEVI